MTRDGIEENGYHALVHLHLLCAGLYDEGNPAATRFEQQWTEMLKQDKVCSIIATARNRLKLLGPQPDDTVKK